MRGIMEAIRGRKLPQFTVAKGHKYLKGTRNYTLRFCKSERELTLSGQCDSDWGSAPDRRSISGYCFALNKAGVL